VRIDVSGFWVQLLRSSTILLAALPLAIGSSLAIALSSLLPREKQQEGGALALHSATTSTYKPKSQEKSDLLVHASWRDGIAKLERWNPLVILKCLAVFECLQTFRGRARATV